jgi:hypothetical protein
MAKKSSPSKGKKKGAGEGGIGATVPQDVTIEVCDDGKTAYVGHYITWTNHKPKPCHVEFRKNCPLDECKFDVPAISPLGPGEVRTKVLGPGGHIPYEYTPDCCDKAAGQPTVIIE